MEGMGLIPSAPIVPLSNPGLTVSPGVLVLPDCTLYYAPCQEMHPVRKGLRSAQAGRRRRRADKWQMQVDMDAPRANRKVPTFAERLRRLAREPVEKRRERVRELGEESDPEALLVLLHLLDDRSVDVRLDVLEMLGRKRSLTARIAARALLEDPNTLIRTRAADILGEVGNRQDVPRLITALRDPRWEVRSSAAIALGLLGGKSACKAVCAALPLERQWIARRDLAFALGDLGGPEAHAAAAQQLARERDEAVRVGLLWALYRCGEPGRLEEYLSYLNSEDDLVRHNVINGLDGANFDAEERARVVVALRHVAENDEFRPVRCSAESMLKTLG